jgi:hypothetical protein
MIIMVVTISPGRQPCNDRIQPLIQLFRDYFNVLRNESLRIDAIDSILRQSESVLIFGSWLRPVIFL